MCLFLEILWVKNVVIYVEWRKIFPHHSEYFPSDEGLELLF